MTKDLDKKVAHAMELHYERGFIDGMQKQMQRTWVGLTDEEITALFGLFPKYPSEWDDPDFYRLTQAIEARLKELNT